MALNYFNCGAQLEGEWIPTKTALKMALFATEPVKFIGTASHDLDEGPEFFFSNNVPEGVKLSVVGPDPHSKRNWYATVVRINGKLKVI